MQQWFVTGFGWGKKREDFDLASVLPAFAIHWNVESAIAIFLDENLPVQVVRLMDEIGVFLKTYGFLRHLTVSLLLERVGFATKVNTLRGVYHHSRQDRRM